MNALTIMTVDLSSHERNMMRVFEGDAVELEPGIALSSKGGRLLLEVSDGRGSVRVDGRDVYEVMEFDGSSIVRTADRMHLVSQCEGVPYADVEHGGGGGADASGAAAEKRASRLESLFASGVLPGHLRDVFSSPRPSAGSAPTRARRVGPSLIWGIAVAASAGLGFLVTMRHARPEPRAVVESTAAEVARVADPASTFGRTIPSAEVASGSAVPTVGEPDSKRAPETHSSQTPRVERVGAPNQDSRALARESWRSTGVPNAVGGSVQGTKTKPGKHEVASPPPIASDESVHRWKKALAQAVLLRDFDPQDARTRLERLLKEIPNGHHFAATARQELARLR